MKGENKMMLQTPIVYLKAQLDRNGDFVNEWKRLSEKDKVDLKQWAEDELREIQ